MTNMNISNIRKNFSAVIVSATRGERTIITRRGRPAAGIISFEDYELIQRLRACKPEAKNKQHLSNRKLGTEN